MARRPESHDPLTYAAETAETTETGCLLVRAWTPMRKGYVRIRYQGRNVLIHRLVAERTLGRLLLPHESVDHTCHNDSGCPGGNECVHRRCIEPTHLEVTDPVTNWQRGNQGIVQTRRDLVDCPQGHPYSGANVRIRPDGARECRACKRARAAGRNPRLEPVWDVVMARGRAAR